jgi:tRNA(Ile)-lysidine synthase
VPGDREGVGAPGGRGRAADAPGGAGPADRPLAVAREGGLVRAGEPLLVLVSGGADSTCLLDVAVRLGADASALHVDHGLRPDSGEDAELCRRLCGRLGVPLEVERVEIAAAHGPGNVQAEAREARYALAERRADGDYATAHTASDQAETVLYRLATSPGRRALLGMPARRGRLVRPLLGATRDETRAYCRARGLEWRDDPANEDVRFARARVRHEVLPALRELSPAAERTIAETALTLRDEAEVLDRALDGALDRPAEGPLPLEALRALPAALGRLALRRAAEAAAGAARAAASGADAPPAAVPVSRRDADRILALPLDGTATVELPGGVRAVSEYGSLRFAAEPDPGPPEPVALPVPGEAAFGGWRVAARLVDGGAGAEPGEALLDRSALGGPLTVRAWRAGDRMRPAGLGGTKTLQDLFTDRKVPRAERARVPIVEAGGEIAWVAGLAVDERFRAGPDASGGAVGLSARRSP